MISRGKEGLLLHDARLGIFCFAGFPAMEYGREGWDI